MKFVIAAPTVQVIIPEFAVCENTAV